MNFQELSKHQVIAWDFDGTLVDGKNANILRGYIRNHPEKIHYIITFRTGVSRIVGKANLQTWANDCLDELKAYGNFNIAGVYGIPSEIMRHYGNKDSKPEDIQKLLEWKGKKASELGATLLVDDLEQMVIAGCKKYNVSFLDSSK